MKNSLDILLKKIANLLFIRARREYLLSNLTLLAAVIILLS